MANSAESTGMREVVEVAVAAISLEPTCKKVMQDQQWNEEKTKEVENKYRGVLVNFVLAFEGHGIVVCSESDTALLWQAHCEEGDKFASDMHSLAKVIVSFRNKSLDEKFPGSTD